jgi:hypothetical protein
MAEKEKKKPAKKKSGEKREPGVYVTKEKRVSITGKRKILGPGDKVTEKDLDAESVKSFLQSGKLVEVK